MSRASSIFRSDIASCADRVQVTARCSPTGMTASQAGAVKSKLKHLARTQGAVIWPNHDFAFYRSLAPFPAWHE